ncbi:hypothetical protein IMG5_167810, partial [Ichthyophthirius multifiliis]
MLQDYGVLGLDSNENFIMYDCNSKLPDLYFYMQDINGKLIEYSLPQEFYTMQMGLFQCAILVSKLDIQDVQIILGNTFMRKTLGLAESISNPNYNY